MVPSGVGSGSCGGNATGAVVVAADQIGQPVEGAPGQRCGVLPALAKHRFQVGDGRSTNGQLDVVPRRRRPVDRGHRLALRISGVVFVVTAAVTQVDATDERDVEFRPTGMTQHDEFLVVRTAGPDPHVPEAFTAGGLDVLTEMPVLLLAEGEPVQVRAPHQALDHHPPPCCVGEDPRDLGARPVQQLVGIPAPIGEHQQVAGPQRRHAAEQLSEVRLAMDQRGDVIANGERRAVGVAAVEPGGRIAALGRTEEPPGHGHGDIQPRPNAVTGIRCEQVAISSSPGRTARRPTLHPPT